MLELIESLINIRLDKDQKDTIQRILIINFEF